MHTVSGSDGACKYKRYSNLYFRWIWNNNACPGKIGKFSDFAKEKYRNIYSPGHE